MAMELSPNDPAGETGVPIDSTVPSPEQASTPWWIDFSHEEFRGIFANVVTTFITTFVTLFVLAASVHAYKDRQANKRFYDNWATVLGFAAGVLAVIGIAHYKWMKQHPAPTGSKDHGAWHRRAKNLYQLLVVGALFAGAYYGIIIIGAAIGSAVKGSQ